ncbi:haloacid dehalogenase type II [Arthrobacter roseus]|uniref:haloacid dehalogenase type II n=1 Tax=Arthrobacter roseus TaxID=136274 RepID=UPI0019663712|nr:haloacid dehalogenase type II [Arthrobacter roseus]MBM7846828.1 2-haloacid dehalogenase [Arthrobacter roseus]
MKTPEVIVFDVNETLSDTAPLGAAFQDAGLPAHAAQTWFTGILRDGFALAAAGGNVPFAEIAKDSLERLMAQAAAGAAAVSERSQRVDQIMTSMKDLSLHPDVVLGIPALARTADLVTLSNGATTVADKLLSEGHIREYFSHLLSVDDAAAWKPAAAAYSTAMAACGKAAEEMLLVAVHPWDIHGANAAGMQTAWINRDGNTYPSYFTPPTYEAVDLPSLAEQLALRPTH